MKIMFIFFVILAFSLSGKARAGNLPDNYIYYMTLGGDGPEYHSPDYNVNINWFSEDMFSIEVHLARESNTLIHQDYTEGGKIPEISSVNELRQCSQSYILVSTVTAPPKYADIKSYLHQTFVFNRSTGQFYTKYSGDYYDLFTLVDIANEKYEVGTSFISFCNEKNELVIKTQ